MQQSADFWEENEVLAAALGSLDDWTRPTQFKGWTVNDVMVHLHFWNEVADLSLTAPSRFDALMAQAMPAIQQAGMRPFENAHVTERGPALLAAWQDRLADMAPRWHDIDPKARLRWAGPDMSARSMMTARQMETWAHGQEIFDLIGQPQPQSDRIRNIVVLGVNTFGWAHKVHGLPVPEQMPQLHLTAPSGAVWTYGDSASPDQITGDAVAFAQIVTQTRNIADTALAVHGPTATQWMAIAQCFAGPPETPPAPGTRFRQPEGQTT
ncbi:MAG: TIGR03084 family metal-binding protein [Pseudomonadota bacterium]